MNIDSIILMIGLVNAIAVVFDCKSCHLVSLAAHIILSQWFTQLVVDHLVPLAPHQHTLVGVVWWVWLLVYSSTVSGEVCDH